ncbi:MAG: zinc dependent phospholipase C family protein [Peptostreptococcales bacterium]
MDTKLEKVYSRLFHYFGRAINPFKKIVIKTECKIHKFINIQALGILENDGYGEARNLLCSYIIEINKGAVWADQDLKSSGHFFNPYKDQGLYGNTNALKLALNYYDKALKYWKQGEKNFSMFYLGAAVHLVQDMTIPQHANIRLFNSHRQYENFIKKTYLHTGKYRVEKGGIYLESVEEFIRYNAKTAIQIYCEMGSIKNNNERFHEMTQCILPLAQRTTAGCFKLFCKDAFCTDSIGKESPFM